MTMELFDFCTMIEWMLFDSSKDSRIEYDRSLCLKCLKGKLFVHLRSQMLDVLLFQCSHVLFLDAIEPWNVGLSDHHRTMGLSTKKEPCDLPGQHLCLGRMVTSASHSFPNFRSTSSSKIHHPKRFLPHIICISKFSQ